MNETLRIFLELLAAMGVVAGPIIAYLAAKRTTEAKVRLIDIEAIKGWSEQRQSWEREIKQLHSDLDEERERRREDRDRYIEDLSKIEALVAELSAKLKIAEDTSTMYKNLLDEQVAKQSQHDIYHQKIEAMQKELSTILIDGMKFNKDLQKQVTNIRHEISELRKELRERYPIDR